MKTLVVGDIHTKLHLVERVSKLFDDYDKVIFLGDYEDEWGATPDQSYETVSRLIELKKANPEKLVLLVGNHGLSEWLGRDFACSGYNPNTHTLLKPLYDENESLFDIAYADDRYLYSHAGFTNQWLKDVDALGNVIDESGRVDIHKLADWANTCFHLRDGNELANYIFWKRFSTAGPARGGLYAPSPIWADKDELIKNPVPFIDQVVGHTPVSTIVRHEFKNGDGTRNTLWFCDTLSLAPLLHPIGDGSLLSFEGRDMSPTVIKGTFTKYGY